MESARNAIGLWRGTIEGAPMPSAHVPTRGRIAAAGWRGAQIVARLFVGDSVREVVRAVRGRITKKHRSGRAMRWARRAAYFGAFHAHGRNAAIYHCVQRGTMGADADMRARARARTAWRVDLARYGRGADTRILEFWKVGRGWCQGWRVIPPPGQLGNLNGKGAGYRLSVTRLPGGVPAVKRAARAARGQWITVHVLHAF